MKSIWPFKKSAMFVDVLLVTGAIIAIIGLATFVRLKGYNKPQQTNQRGYINYSANKFDALPEDNNTTDKNKPQGNNSPSGNAVLDAHTDVDNNAPSSHNHSNAEPHTRPICDELKRLKLQQEYEKGVSYYESLKNQLNSQDALTKPTNQQLLNKSLSELKINYVKSLNELNCPTDI